MLIQIFNLSVVGLQVFVGTEEACNTNAQGKVTFYADGW